MSSSAPTLQTVVYANNAPPASAKLLGDVRADAAARFSVPLANVALFTLKNKPLDDATLIIEAPTKLFVDIESTAGQSTRYETELGL